jgi:hypothetical protein
MVASPCHLNNLIINYVSLLLFINVINDFAKKMLHITVPVLKEIFLKKTVCG